MRQVGLEAHARSCTKCGVRDLLGELRYGLGDCWYDDNEGKSWVRCQVCERITGSPEDLDVRLRETCYGAEFAKSNSQNRRKGFGTGGCT